MELSLNHKVACQAVSIEALRMSEKTAIYGFLLICRTEENPAQVAKQVASQSCYLSPPPL